MMSESQNNTRCNHPVDVSLGYNYSCTAPGCSYPCRSLESFVAHSIKHIDFDYKGGRDSETILAKFQDVWYCSLCEFGSRNKILYTEHLRQHMLPNAYACSRCQAGVENVQALKRHNSNFHSRLSTRLTFQQPSGFLDLILSKLNQNVGKTFFLKIKEEMIVFICQDMLCWFVAQFKSYERIDLSHVFLSKSLTEEINVKKISGNCIFIENDYCFDEGVKKDIEKSHFIFLEKLKAQLQNKTIFNEIESEINHIGRYTTKESNFVCLKCDYHTLDQFQIMEHVWFDIHLATKKCLHKKVNSSLCDGQICAILDSIVCFLLLQMSNVPRQQQNSQSNYLFLSPEHNFYEPEHIHVGSTESSKESNILAEVDQRSLDYEDSNNINPESQSGISLEPDYPFSEYLRQCDDNSDEVELISDNSSLKYVCDICTFTCNTEHDFDVHKLFCLSSEAQLSGNLTCPKCHFSCDSVNVILDHLSHHLGQTQLKVFTCRYCNDMFSSMVDVNQHVKQRHSTEHAIAPAKSKCFIKVVRYLDGMFKCLFCGSAHKWPFEFISHLKDQHKNYTYLSAYLSKKYLHGKPVGTFRATLPKITFPRRLLSLMAQPASCIQNRSENSNPTSQHLDENKLKNTNMISKNTNMISKKISTVSTVKRVFKRPLGDKTASDRKLENSDCASSIGQQRKKNIPTSGNKVIRDQMQVCSKATGDGGSKDAEKRKGHIDDEGSLNSRRTNEPLKRVNDSIKASNKLLSGFSLNCGNTGVSDTVSQLNKKKKVSDPQFDLNIENNSTIVAKKVPDKEDTNTIKNIFGKSSNATKINLPSSHNFGIPSAKRTPLFYLCNYCNFKSCSLKKFGKHLLRCGRNSILKSSIRVYSGHHRVKKINFFPVVRLVNRVDFHSFLS